VRDLSEMRSFGHSNVTSVYLTNVYNLDFNLMATTTTAVMSEGFWLTQVNDDWVPYGYFVAPTDAGAGTLYRFSTNSPGQLGVRRDEVLANNDDRLLRMFQDVDLTRTNVVRRVADGVVHFDLLATYMITNMVGTNVVVGSFTTPFLGFRSNDLPAYIDVELGVLEPDALRQFQAIADLGDTTAAKRFVMAQAGKVHFLRERVPIRSFINPYRSNEVP
jgi:hypothetical protein